MLLKYSILFLLFLVMSLYGAIPGKQRATPTMDIKVNSASITFDTDVKPIFERHCNPCHFPGGKLYDRLPFDQASTIIKHEQGILKRISDADEVKMIREFVQQSSSSDSSSSAKQ